LAGAGLIAVILAIVALNFGREAVRERQFATDQANISLSRELARAAANNYAVDTELSVLLALEAVEIAKTLEAENALHNALQRYQLSQTLAGHTGVVSSVAYSQDGSRLVTVGEDGVKVWDAQSGDELFGLEPDVSTSAAVFSPDGKLLVLGNWDGVLEIWDVPSGNQLRTLDYRTSLNAEASAAFDPVVSISFSHDGKLLMSGYTRQLTRIWNIESGEYQVFAGHAARGRFGGDFDLDLSPDSSLIVTVGADGTIRLWDVVSGEEKLVLLASGPEKPELSPSETVFPGYILFAGPEAGRQVSVDFNSDGTRLATAVSDGAVSVWDLSTDFQEAIQTLVINESTTAMAFSPDSTRLATIGKEGVARIWDSSTGRELLTLAGHTSPGTHLAFSPDGRYLATSSQDGTVKIWDVYPGGELLTLVGEGFNSIALSPDGNRLITAGESLVIWDSFSGEKLQSLDIKNVGKIALSPNGAYLVASQTLPAGDTISLWDMDTSRELFQLPNPALIIDDIEFHPGGMNLTTSHDNCVTRVWQLESRLIDYVINQDKNFDVCVFDSAYSWDAKYLLTGSRDDTARLYEANSGDELLKAQANTDVISVAFSPEESRFGTGESDGTVTVWDIVEDEGRPFFSLPGHSGFVEDLVFSPDGLLLSSAGADGKVKVWDLSIESESDDAIVKAATSRELLALFAHRDVVTDIVFSPDSKRLITASKDGTVRIYTLVLEELVTIARQRVTRSLTTKECQQYLHLNVCPVHDN